jgi:DNA-binding NarL/FixJ family response regulator
VAQPVRIVLVEDNQVFREALELLLGSRSDVDVVAAVADGAQAVPACKAYDPDVVLMDYRLPGIDGAAATAAVRASCPDVAVVCLTATASEAERTAVLEAGAVACITKDRELEEIVEAVKSAAHG